MKKIGKILSKAKPKQGLKLRHIVFLALILSTIIAALGSYAVSSLPSVKVYEKTVYKVSHNVDCSYNVMLYPNFIYDNASVIGMDKIAYLKLSKGVNVTCKYSVKSSKPISLIGTYGGAIYLEGEDMLPKKIGDLLVDEFENTATFTMYLNISQINGYIGTIEEETGLKNSKYDIRISPIINVNYTLAGISKKFSETITPNPIMVLDYGEKTITFKNLHGEKPVEEKETYTMPTYVNLMSWQIPVSRLKIFTYMTTIALTSATATMWAVIIRRKEVEEEYKTILEKYSDLIIKTTRKPPEKGRIELESFTDLLKISANLNKPILYTKANPEHIFWTIGNKETYTYISKSQNK